MTHSNYDILTINETSKGTDVKVQFLEGDYELVERESEIGEVNSKKEYRTQYMRKKLINQNAFRFPKGTTLKEIEIYFNKAIKNYTKLSCVNNVYNRQAKY